MQSSRLLFSLKNLLFHLLDHFLSVSFPKSLALKDFECSYEVKELCWPFPHLPLGLVNLALTSSGSVCFWLSMLPPELESEHADGDKGEEGRRTEPDERAAHLAQHIWDASSPLQAAPVYREAIALSRESSCLCSELQ